MRRHLKSYLNDAALQAFGDRYDGVIEAVTEEIIRNRYTGTKDLEPIIRFEDGWRLIPNLGMRRALIEFFGPDTDDWIGRRLTVFRHRLDRMNPKTGVVTSRWEKAVMRGDVPRLASSR